ncbi:DUF4365 domain-containing protein [Nocardia transvalensis]|uniref:DUF4365 domain-containing protein n=1 Tax=Nocardia transvalensis TaxID=37333 RepID=UPI001895EF95|nr:DUF4365 domain-containing protein [Nocardia transvalensis]MBF6332350.1 DUF4365 domain-containing protein [Nocardia transvalensis]
MRPESHVNSDISITKLHRAFLAAGWTVEEVRRDYGEDLQVRIFDRGEATPYRFFVQAKAITDATRSRSRDGRYVSYPIERHHLEAWNGFSEPVVLTLWDVARDQIYWDIAQSLEWPPTSTKTRSCTIRFPTDNLLDSAGLARIRARTIGRAQRREIELQGVEVLIERIHELFDAAVTFEPHEGRIRIDLPNGEADITYFGRRSQVLQELMKHTGLAAEGAVFMQYAILEALVRYLDKGNPIPLIKDGSLELLSGNSGEVIRQLVRAEEIGPTCGA